jgi:hypothetical protein
MGGPRVPQPEHERRVHNSAEAVSAEAAVAAQVDDSIPVHRPARADGSGRQRGSEVAGERPGAPGSDRRRGGEADHEPAGMHWRREKATSRRVAGIAARGRLAARLRALDGLAR